MDKIAIVEDDANIRELIRCAMESAGFGAAAFSSAEDFLADGGGGASLLLLDVMLPGMDGFTLLSRLRSLGSQIPVIFLTAKGAETDIVAGLNMGACDYVPKPFGVLELIARVKSALRGREGQIPEAITAGRLTLDPASRAVTVDGSPVALTFKEYELLYRLMANAGIALTRDSLMEKIWGVCTQIESRTLDMHVSALRQKLGEAGAYIKTVRSVGYKFSAEKT